MCYVQNRMHFTFNCENVLGFFLDFSWKWDTHLKKVTVGAGWGAPRTVPAFICTLCQCVMLWWWSAATCFIEKEGKWSANPWHKAKTDNTLGGRELKVVFMTLEYAGVINRMPRVLIQGAGAPNKPSFTELEKYFLFWWAIIKKKNRQKINMLS